MRNCGCSGGNCEVVQPMEMTRRAFLGQVAVGTAGVALASQLQWLEQAAAAETSPPVHWPEYLMTPLRVYRDQYREAVAMPIGGIGTGSIWLDGQGRLGVWQIFNNLSETRIPDSFFAIRAKVGDGPAVTRVLQTTDERSFQPMESLDYEGGYPIARLKFRDEAITGASDTGRIQPANPLGHGQFQYPLRDFPAYRSQHGTGTGGSEPAGCAAERRGQSRLGRHQGRAVRWLRGESQPSRPRKRLDGGGHGQVAGSDVVRSRDRSLGRAGRRSQARRCSG